MSVVVPRVLKVKSINILKSNPPLLEVIAVAEVTSTSWSKPHLSPHVYISEPSDGIQDYTFLATPPDRTSATVLTEIESAPSYIILADWIKGVRVHGADKNPVEVMISDEDKQKSTHAKDGQIPWPWGGSVIGSN